MISHPDDWPAGRAKTVWVLHKMKITAGIMLQETGVCCLSASKIRCKYKG
jgi:hypothetical protein